MYFPEKLVYFEISTRVRCPILSEPPCSFVEVCGGISWVLMIAMGLWRHEYPDYMDVEVTFVAVEGDGGK